MSLVLSLSLAFADEPAAGADEAQEEAPADTTAAGVIGALTRGQEEDREERIEQFLKEVVWFQDIGYFTTTGAQVGSASYPKRGKYGEVLRLPEFYEAVGREDLASELKTKRLVNGVVNLAAYSSLIFAGVQGMRGLLTYGDNNDCYLIEDPVQESLCESAAEADAADQKRAFFTQAGVFGGVAVGGFVFTGINRPTRVQQHERREMADTHNKALLDELGLTEDDLKSLSGSVRPPVRGELRPWFAPTGVGASVDFQW
jgi:hypothetical protein